MSIRRSYPKSRKTSDILPLFSKVATTSHYELFFQALPTKLLGHIQYKEPLCSRNFIFRELGLLCRSTALPGATFATAQVNGHYMGRTEKFAHTRLYSDASFTFTVDNEYKVLSFFNFWQEFIENGSGEERQKKAFYSRMQYPVEYKASTMRLQKFDKDHFRTLDYTFVNAFPLNVVPSAVSYDGSRVLEVTVTFAYDRFVIGKFLSTEKTEKQLTSFDNPYGVGNDPRLRTPEARRTVQETKSGFDEYASQVINDPGIGANDIPSSSAGGFA